MNKIDKILIKFALLALPFIGLLLIWGTISDPNKVSLSEGNLRTLWDILGWVLMAWTVASFYLSIKTVFSSKFRNILLTKVTRVNERDEREVEISQSAAKFSYFSTLAVLLLLLFLSLFTIEVGKYPKREVQKDKKGYISIGMNFKSLNLDETTKRKKDDKGRIIVQYTGLPMTHGGMLLFIILWKLGSYHLTVRRQLYS